MNITHRWLIVPGVLLAAAVSMAAEEPAPDANAPAPEAQAPAPEPAAWEAAHKRGLALIREGKYTEGIQAAELAVAETEKEFGPDHPKTAAMLNNLGGAYRARMDADRNEYVRAATPLYERALAICEAKFGPEHATVAAVLTNLSQVYKTEGRYADAERVGKRALDVWKRMYGPNDPRVAVGINHLADLYKSQGRFKEAEAAYQEAMERFQETLGPGHPMVESSLDDLTQVMEMAEREKTERLQPMTPLLEDVKTAGQEQNADKGTAAVAQLQWKLEAMEATLGKNHPNVAAIVNSIGDVHMAHARYAEAEPHYKRALSIDENAFGPVHERVAKDLNRLAALNAAQERWAEAEPHYARMVSIMEQVLDELHPDLLRTLGHQADCLDKLGKAKEAKAIRDRLEQAERSMKGR